MILVKQLLLKKNSYFTSKDCDYFDIDPSDYHDYHYEFVDEDYYDYDDDYDYDDFDYHDYDDDDLYYKKPFNNFERLRSVNNNIVNWIDRDNYNDKINLLVTDHRICIC